MVAIAIFAPWLGTIDPQAVAPIKRLKPPSAEYWLGTDMLGRDVYSRVVYGARVSLLVGLAVALFSTVLGLGDRAGHRLRALAGRRRDAGDGRADVDSVGAARHRADGAYQGEHRERDCRHHAGRSAARGASCPQPRAHACASSRTSKRRSLPARPCREFWSATSCPISSRRCSCKATYVCGSAMITEAILSFIGAGTPPNIPSWGNIMAEGRSLIQIARVSHHISRHLPVADGARRQSARRRHARRARSAAGAPHVRR